MKIPAALEQMVAGLISDERAEKERVEAVLSQIHKLTEEFYEPEQEGVLWSAPLTPDTPAAIEAAAQPSEPISQERLLENAIKFNMRRGDDKSTAEYKAKKQFGIED